MKRNVSFLLFLLLTFFTFKLDAAENGIRKRSYADAAQLAHAANFSSDVKNSPIPLRRKTKALRKKRAVTSANPIERVRTSSAPSEDEMTLTEQRDHIKKTSRMLANAAISAALEKKAASLYKQTESKEEGSLGLQSLFEQTSTELTTTHTEPEITPAEQPKTPREIASLLATERDRLDTLVNNARKNRDAKKAEIDKVHYDLSCTYRDTAYAFKVLQSVEKANTDSLKKLQTQKALAAIDPTGNYHADYYQQQFETAQKNLTQAREKHNTDDQTHRALVYKHLSLQQELTDLKKTKSALLAQTNEVRGKRRLNFAKHNFKSTSWWPIFGIDPDADCADSDAEETVAPLSKATTVIGCLTESETSTLTNA